MGNGGEILMLDMGEPIKILDLAQDLIRLSGLEVDRDIKIAFTGLEPGEKLYEELLTPQEGVTATKHQRIFVAQLEEIEERQLSLRLRNSHNLRIRWTRKVLFPNSKNWCQHTSRTAHSLQRRAT
jgi:FlaA1/EpsC-like NDP-sugar epimerase